MNLPKFNSADGRCYWMKPEVQEELQPLFDQCIQDAIDGKITRLDDSHWPPVVVSSQGAPFEVWQLLRAWTEIQRAETLDAEKAIAFSENLRRQSRWGEIDHHLLDMLKRELLSPRDAYRLMLKDYPDVMDIGQMCEALGVSTKTGYKLLKDGKIEYLKIGRAYRIPKAHILRYLKITCSTFAE